MTARSSGSGRKHLVPLAIFALCIAPLAVAWLLTRSGIGWEPDATVNVGELVKPPLPLGTSGLRLANGEALRPDGLRGKWRIASVAVKNCGMSCRNSLTTMRHVQLALGKHVLRVQRVLFLPKGSESVDRKLLEEYPRPLVLTIDEGLAEFLGQLGIGSSEPERTRFFIIDPRGRLILKYPDATYFAGMVKDLSRLLKASNRV